MTNNLLQIKESPKVYLENEKCLTVHVEWCDSIMLFNHIYHKYDDISRTHCHQMRYVPARFFLPANKVSKDNCSLMNGHLQKIVLPADQLSAMDRSLIIATAITDS